MQLISKDEYRIDYEMGFLSHFLWDVIIRMDEKRNDVL